MFKEWRTKLFESPNQEFDLHPLGFPLSLAEGTRILGICYRTVIEQARKRAKARYSLPNQ